MRLKRGLHLFYLGVLRPSRPLIARNCNKRKYDQQNQANEFQEFLLFDKHKLFKRLLF